MSDEPVRLAYRIATQRFAFQAGSPPMPLDLGRQEQKAIKACHVFTLDNVVEFIETSPPRTMWDCPNWAPPMTCFFAEWNHSRGQTGWLVTAGDPDRYRERAFESLQLSDAEWVLSASLWGADFCGEFPGVPKWFGLAMAISVGARGNLIDAVVIKREESCTSDITGLIVPVGMGISFTHCKNVVSREFQPASNKWLRRHRLNKGIRFHTLEINPMKKTLRSEGQSEETAIKKAMHICRGHFATYSDDHPLFGKYTGTFWKQDHVRGSIEHGTVFKDYSVKA